MAEQKKGMSKGCMIALIVVGIIAVIVIALSVVCYVKRDDIANAVLNKSQEWVAQQIKANLPEGYTAEDVDRITNNFIDAIKEGRISEEKFNSLIMKFREQTKDQNISKEEAKELLEEMKKLLDSAGPVKVPEGQ